MLAGRGLYILSISESGGINQGLRKFFGSGGKRIKRAEIIDFAGNLSVMIGAGLPILTTLSDISSATTNQSLRSILEEIGQSIELGSGFSDALEPHSDVFPDIFIRLVKVGEETGRFEQSLKEAAEHLQRIEDLSASIKRAMIYPLFAIVTTFGALAFWMIYVLPKMVVTIQGMGVKLPLLTRGLIKASALSQSYWYVAIILPIVGAIAIKLTKRNEQGSYQIDRLKLKLPIYSLIEYTRLLALFSEQMRIMIVAGLTFDKTLDITAEVMGNEVFRRAIENIREDITYGSSIVDALKRHPVFPPLMVRMIGVGERSGTLDEQFSFLASHYLKILDDTSEKLGKIIEPIVIIGVGILFAVIIAGLLLPVYDLVSKVGKG